MDKVSDSGFIALGNITYEWTDISVFQERKSNVLYYAQRYGKRYVIKGLHADYQSKTDFRLLQEKEFALGIALNHPHIAETYSLEEVEGCGRCIVMEYVDGTTLAEWLASKPSQTARERVMIQLLDALAYIHSMQLVHHDLKSSNILITRNGQNVKLIDFGLSELDATNPQNDIQQDIQKFGQILHLLFPTRYQHIRKQCMQGHFANIAAIRHAIEKRQRRQKQLPFLVAIIILLVSVLPSVRTYRLYQESEQMATAAEQYMKQKHREQEMVEKVHFYVEKELEPLQNAADSVSSYLELTQHPLYMGVWQTQMKVRDSLANTYADDPALRHQCIEVWAQSFGEQFLQIDTKVKASKPLQ